MKTALALTIVMAGSTAFAGEIAEGSKVKPITVEELAKAQKGDTKPVVFDANSDDTRAKFGVVPGATLLSHYRTFNAAKELPKAKDQQLVFYCSSVKCSAAPKAAEKAVKAGYDNVYVLREGIKGWVKAGKSVDKFVKKS